MSTSEVPGNDFESVPANSNASPPGIATSKSTTEGLCFLASVSVDLA
ncbi:MAG: hypothetical protein ACKO35_06840 [Planctomycetaceae bacterium]